MTDGSLNRLVASFLAIYNYLLYFPYLLCPWSKSENLRYVLFQLINIGSHYQYGNDDHAEFLCVVSREYPHTASQDKLQEPTDRAKVTARILLSILFTLSSAQHINIHQTQCFVLVYR